MAEVIKDEEEGFGHSTGANNEILLEHTLLLHRYTILGDACAVVRARRRSLPFEARHFGKRDPVSRGLTQPKWIES